ncbi:hypothetical protein CMI37_03165 [Candidatus Pacearchaeota archaeon]|nr:hypothetical protein [Candidatus Pacearchaeota archaeon]
MEVSTTNERLGSLVTSLEAVGHNQLPATVQAFNAASKTVIMGTWKSYALGAPIAGSPFKIKHATGAYARSIKHQVRGPFDHLVYSDSPYAGAIEDGSAEIDMKQTHTKGPKSRRAKAGHGYLIVPFRWNVPGGVKANIMPDQVYAQIRAGIRNDRFQVSKVLDGRVVEPNYSGELVPRHTYQWGSRFKSTLPGEENLQGLVAMENTTAAQARTSYVTFRIISERSPAHKWVRPAQPGMRIVESVARNTQPIVEEMITDGLMKDLGVS